MFKRIFDIVVAIILLGLFSVVVLFSVLLASFDTGTNGIFVQERIGQFGVRFNIYKLRTIRNTLDSEMEISKIGRLLRKYKLDELPQLINVLKGEMSIVGPRPDVAGYYDALVGADRKVLDLKPGLTSRASLKYIQEEALLASMDNSLYYNDTVIFPDKVKMNLDYYNSNGILEDVKIIFETVKKIVF